jgi:hypothetical protein
MPSQYSKTIYRSKPCRLPVLLSHIYSMRSKVKTLTQNLSQICDKFLDNAITTFIACPLRDNKQPARCRISTRLSYRFGASETFCTFRCSENLPRRLADSILNKRYLHDFWSDRARMHNRLTEAHGQRPNCSNAEKSLWEKKMLKRKSYSPRNKRI